MDKTGILSENISIKKEISEKIDFEVKPEDFSTFKEKGFEGKDLFIKDGIVSEDPMKQEREYSSGHVSKEDKLSIGDGACIYPPGCTRSHPASPSLKTAQISFQCTFGVCTCRMSSVNAEYFDSEKFIHEIEKRPAIFDKKLKEYRDKTIKDKLWTEVCEAMQDDLEEMEEEEKRKLGQELQKRWKNMKDSFRKELNTQKNQASGSGQRKRRKYLYFDQLLFLLPTMEQRATGSNYGPITENEEEDIHSVEGSDTSTETVQNVATKKQETVSMIARGNKKTGNTGGKKVPYEESLLKILQESREEEVDEDKMFLNSLLSSMKQVPPTKKLKLKIDFLQCIQKAMEPDVAPVQGQLSNHTVPYYFPHPNYSQHQASLPHPTCPSPQGQHSEILTAYSSQPPIIRNVNTHTPTCSGAYVFQNNQANIAGMAPSHHILAPSPGNALSPTDSLCSLSSGDKPDHS